MWLLIDVYDNGVGWYCKKCDVFVFEIGEGFVGLKIIKDCLCFLSRKFGCFSDFEIVDLFDEMGVLLGILVKLYFEIND